MLKSSSFGSYRDLLENVSLHPIMAQYLSLLQNQKAILDTAGNPITSPDENFAREIMQLFSIGLVNLHPDGSLKLGSDGLPISTYTQIDIAAIARVFTGWSYSKRNNPTNSNNVVDNTNFFQINGIVSHMGFHPIAPDLATLFNAGDLSVVCNVGSLAYPVPTRSDYLGGLVPLPQQLFSHSDQQTQWQSSVPDKPFTSGWSVGQPIC
jgi:hypothetical protein